MLYQQSFEELGHDIPTNNFDDTLIKNRKVKCQFVTPLQCAPLVSISFIEWIVVLWFTKENLRRCKFPKVAFISFWEPAFNQTLTAIWYKPIYIRKAIKWDSIPPIYMHQPINLPSIFYERGKNMNKRYANQFLL